MYLYRGIIGVSVGMLKRNTLSDVNFINFFLYYLQAIAKAINHI